MGSQINGTLAAIQKKPAASVAGDQVERAKAPVGGPVKYGRMRHVLALLALSAFVMANMNRQAYNQGLARMIRRRRDTSPGHTPPPPPPPPTQRPNSTLLPPVNELPATQVPPAAVTRLPEGDYPPPSTLPPPPPTTLRPDNQWTLASPLVAGDHHLTPVPEVEPPDPHNQPQEEQYDEEEDGYDWTSRQVGMLQAAFSYGYTLFMIPGGRLSELYGAKWIIFLSSFGSALCSLLTPLFASHSYTLLVCSRILMGLCQTGVSPAMYAFCSRWLPPDEASVYLPMIKVGVMVGFMLGSLLNGFLPWRTMFYVIGLAGLAWSAVWALFATSDPSDHQFLHPEELAYIQASLAGRGGQNKKQTADSEQGEKKSPNGKLQKKSSDSAPWLGIITNPVVLAFTFTKFTVKMSTDTQSMQIPMYLRQVFSISDGLNGALNGANFAIQALLTGLVAYTAKEMVVRKKFGLNKTGVRILFQSINNFGMGLAYLLISFNMGSLNLVCGAVIILCCASMFGAGGEAVLPIDLTTEYSASIMAIANSVANMSGIILPPIVSYFIANDYTNTTHWNKVWWFVSASMICGGFMFACCVQAKIQDFEGKRRVRRGRQQAEVVARSVEPKAAGAITYSHSSTNTQEVVAIPIGGTGQGDDVTKTTTKL